MTNIANLSTELLLNIVSHLTTGHQTDVRALLSTCLTSRRYSDVALPALYTCVRVPEPVAEPLGPLKLFLRTLIQHPSLAKNTRELALINDLGVRYDWPALEHDTVFMDIAALIFGQPLELEPEFCYHPFAIQVLARLPNLEHIHFTAQIEQPRALLRRIHELRVKAPFLPKLRTFHLLLSHKQYEDGPVDIDEYTPLLRHLPFERFSTENDVRDVPEGPRAINIVTPKTAELYWSMRPLASIRQLLDACPRLSVFKFIATDMKRSVWNFDVAYDPLVTPRELIEALLLTHSQILETLHLDFHHYYDLNDPELREEIQDSGEPLEDSVLVFPSLRRFERLKHMTIEFEKLLKVRDLPLSLETLNLQFCHFEELEQDYVRDLARLKGTWCPEIKVVNVSGWERTDDSNLGILSVRDSARVLDLLVHESADGRSLMFLEVGFEFTINSLHTL
ncbi:hypothetical protein NX059_005748 [Plenodomus lindquistii]|nr:hypothetical protein NX059_005748 [Plenodomus lindquistii]